MNLQGLEPLVSSALFWLLASLLVGSLANQLPPGWLLGRGRISEAPAPPASRWHVAPAGIRRWKRWVPDAGGVLPGGVRKASLVRRDPEALRRLVIETRRAELVHWVLLPAGLLTGLWVPLPGLLLNLLFATLFNAPCILLQRYNRTRLRHCLACMGV